MTLTFVPFIMVLGNSVLIPALPEMQKQMHVSKFEISLLITLFSVPAGLVIPIAGFLSDRFARKWVIIPALILFGVGGVIAGMAAWLMKNPYGIVMIGRVLQGIGASGTAPIAMALVGDLFSGEQRSKVLGINEAGNAFGKVISPIVGSLVALITWFSVFLVFPVLCIPLAIAIWLWVPKLGANQNTATVGAYIRSVGGIFKQSGRWLATGYLAGASALFTLFGVLFYLSDLLETKYHVFGVHKGFILAIPLLVLGITSFTTGTVIKKHKSLMKWMLVLGFSLMTISYVTSIWLAANAWTLVGLMAAASMGTGVILPSLNMLITSAVDKKQRGIITSFYGSVRFLGVAAGPPVFTWLLSFSTTLMFGSIAGLSAACALLCLSLIRPSTSAKAGYLSHPRQKARA